MGFRGAPLRGREGELAVLAGLADRARQGSGVGVVITGPPGADRSAVLDRVAAREAGLGSTVLRPPPSLDAVGELLGVPFTTGLYPFLRRLQHVLTELTRDRPVCLLIDDLPGEDDLSRLPGFLCRRTERLFVAVTAQAGGAWAADCATVHLGPLPRAAVAELAALRGVPPELAECATSCPLATRRCSPRWHSGVDESLVAVSVHTKLDRLPDQVRAVARAVAVLGCFDGELVGALAGLTPEAATDAVRLLECEHLLWDGQPAWLRA